MFYFLYPFLALLSALSVLLTWILAPVLVLFADSYGNLPRFLYWFQTFDNTLDAGWRVQGNYGTYLIDGRAPTGFTLYKYRVYWLWRNPGYGFDYWPLGCAFDASQWTVTMSNNRWWIASGPNGRFSIKSLAPGVSLKLGWKVWAYWEDGGWKPEAHTWGPERRAPLCFTPKF